MANFNCQFISQDSNSSDKSLGSEGDGLIISDTQQIKRTSTAKENVCNQCNYTSNRRSNLLRHLTTMHQTQVESSMECCNIKFDSKASLKQHKKDFHENGYKCQDCQRDFCRLALLKRHMNVHSGRKDYMCDVCDYATSHKSNLDRHVSRLHPNHHSISRSNSSTEIGKKRAGNPGKRSRFMEGSSSSLSSLDNYSDETTTSLPKPRLGHVSYDCLTCDVSFGSQVDLATHSKLCYVNRYKESEEPDDDSVLMAAIALTQLQYSFTMEEDNKFLHTI